MRKTKRSEHDAPDWLLKKHGITNRQWKSKKRQELRALRKAYNVYLFGCAFCPSADFASTRIGRAIEELRKALSVKEWGN